VITIGDLSSGYGKLVVLHNISMTLPADHFTAVLGPNGSGKSTLLKSILGLADLFGGSIRLGDKELVGVPTEAMSELGLAYVPQRNNVFTALTVRENLLLAIRKLDQTRASKALDDAYKLFPILAKRQTQRAGQLSGGERQMLAMAIGWLTRPRVMLLDEPSAGLSPPLVTEIFRTLKELSAQGITMMVVEQNARSVLRWCSDVFILREGQLVFQGTAEACQQDEEIVKNYLGVSLSAKKRKPQSQSR
jgi:ABC-type branched-subunit amino acid transport system ATPase component